MRSVSVVVSQPLQAADGVVDHAHKLSASLRDGGVDASVVVVNWRSEGARSARRELKRELKRRQATDVVLAYSHLGWSRRGLPFGFIRVLLTCRRVAPVNPWIHDPDGIEGVRFRDRAQSVLKAIGVKTCLLLANSVIVAVPATHVHGLRGSRSTKVVFIPSGSNVERTDWAPPADLFTVATLAIGAGHDPVNSQRLVSVARALMTRIGPFRLRLLGETVNYGVDPEWVEEVRRLGVDVDSPGWLPLDELGRRLAASHVFLSVRDRISPRSGSLACAYATGLPVVGFRGVASVASALAGGVILRDGWEANEIADVLGDLATSSHAVLESLSARSHRAFDTQYAWPVITHQVKAALGISKA